MPENLPSEVQAVTETMQSFIEQTLRPQGARLKASEFDKSESMRAVREASKAAGLFTKTQPEAYGGEPASCLELTRLREMLAAENSELSGAVFGPGPGILHHASGALADEYLAPVLSGEKRGAFGFTEPDSAVRPTYAVLNGDVLSITGQKSYVTGGQNADFVSILVNVEDSEAKKLGTAMVVVDCKAVGVTIGETFQSMEGGGHVSMTFDQVEVNVDRVIGKIGEGLPRALGNIGNVRLMVAAEAMGMCLCVLDIVEAHLKAPHRSGTPLGEKEGVRMRLADMRIETYVARSALYRTARIVDSGDNSVNETIACKVFCTEVAGRVVDMGVQLLGGQALVQGHALELLYRKVRSQRLIEGASDLLRINLAKGKLELSKGRL